SKNNTKMFLYDAGGTALTEADFTNGSIFILQVTYIVA
ncbi:hypothetical protein LCGC14_2078450, partial [marine sediment metagenome]